MSLSPKDIAVVKGFWSKMQPRADEIGAEAVGRMLTVFPQTKAYFSHWSDMKPGSAPVKRHGQLIMGAVNDAVNRIEDMTRCYGQPQRSARLQTARGPCQLQDHGPQYHGVHSHGFPQRVHTRGAPLC
ncbi:hypothetical protein SKAU_G00292130 [Synaphobranchus kaupii]|uniref:Globin domain-containing protein n=1 Tax=Synaphobranchus kaupii TaxID=118154 RepID=A0A9Q1EU06_SYNKA|nr:hypothetical protein SKAU_G00292130 [Synaphobranchus kaupii]